MAIWLSHCKYFDRIFSLSFSSGFCFSRLSVTIIQLPIWFPKWTKSKHNKCRKNETFSFKFMAMYRFLELFSSPVFLFSQVVSANAIKCGLSGNLFVSINSHNFTLPHRHFHWPALLSPSSSSVFFFFIVVVVLFQIIFFRNAETNDLSKCEIVYEHCSSGFGGFSSHFSWDAKQKAAELQFQFLFWVFIYRRFEINLKMMFHSHPSVLAHVATSLFRSVRLNRQASKFQIQVRSANHSRTRTFIGWRKKPIEFSFVSFNSLFVQFMLVLIFNGFVVVVVAFHNRPLLSFACKWFCICGGRKSNYMPESNRESDQSEQWACVRVCEWTYRTNSSSNRFHVQANYLEHSALSVISYFSLSRKIFTSLIEMLNGMARYICSGD